MTKERSWEIRNLLRKCFPPGNSLLNLGYRIYSAGNGELSLIAQATGLSLTELSDYQLLIKQGEARI